MSCVELGEYVLWNGEKFIVEDYVGSSGLFVKSMERDFVVCVSERSVTRIGKPELPPEAPKPEPKFPYETYHTSFTKYNNKKCKWESFSIGDRVQVCFGDWDISCMKTWGIEMGHTGKIVEIKKVLIDENNHTWRIYVQNPLWHYELPDKDPTIMEFLDYEILKVEDKLKELEDSL